MRRLLIIIPLVILIVLGVEGYVILKNATTSDAFTLSGTIEATEIHINTQVGGRIKKIYAAEGDAVHSTDDLVDMYLSTGNINEKINSPIDGTVLERLYEPGELAAPGSTILVVADLDKLTLKVYVSEDKYGKIALGQTYQVTVDSFPNETFSGTVSHIADKAEFTPRNVQTTDSRKGTVFAVTLDLAPSNGKLKPGMPADVHFQGTK